MSQLTKPAVYTPAAAPGYTLAVADHDEALHETDRASIRDIIDSLPARKNIAINGSFRVWQRGTSPTVADNGYGPDRWRLLLEAANAFSVAQETSDVPTSGAKTAAKLTVGSANNNKGGLWQVFEGLDVKHLRGQTVSLQAKLKATAAITDVRMAVVEFTGTEDSVSGDPVGSWGSAGTNPTLATNYAYLGTPANLSPTTSWATYKVEGLTVGASANNLAVLIWCEDESTTQTTDYLLMTDVQLEEGALCTDVERRHYSNELALCQRYTVVQTGIIVVLEGAVQTSGSTIDAPVFWLPREMRAAPTFSHDATAYGSGSTEARAYNYALSADTTVSSLSLTVIRSLPRLVVLRIGNVTNGATANLCQFVAGSGVRLTFSAEL